MTDVLGVMEEWTSEGTAIRTESGERVRVSREHIVSGKPVPPRPPVRLRVGAAEAERHATGAWQPVESAPLGEWLLRASSGFSARANSVLAAGDPGLDVDSALSRVAGFYRSRGLPPLAQVVVGSPEDAALVRAGWVPARPDEADSLFQIAGVARAARRLQGAGGPLVQPVRLAERLTTTWLAADPRAAEYGVAARAVLESGTQVRFAEAGAPDPVARARAALCPAGAQVWVGVTDVWVEPDHRGRGLAASLLRALLGWAAAQGATTAFLQTRADNVAALAAFERMGFAVHHAYRYLRAP